MQVPLRLLSRSRRGEAEGHRWTAPTTANPMAMTVLDRDGREVTSIVLRPIRALDWSAAGIAISQENGPAVLRLE
jgi:hypothetical protein